MTAALRITGVWIGVIGVAVLLGALVVINPQVAFVATLVALGASALAAPAGYWVLAALVAALTFRGLVSLGALPSVATYVDIPLAWGALAAALLRTRLGRTRPDWLRRQLLWLMVLGVVVLASWAFSNAELIRPFLYFALLAEPFALVAALVLDPPPPRLRRALIGTAVALVVVQIPVGLWQATTLGLADSVQGTLYGAGAGAHTMSAVAVVGAIWVASSRAFPRVWRWVLVFLLALLPFLADAKQVIFAIPAILIVGRWTTPKDILVRTTAVAGAVAALIFLAPAGMTAVSFLEKARSGQGGKEEAARVVWDRATSDPANLVFGQGPAMTVSRSAFMSTDLLLRPDSPLRVLDLRPAQLALEAQGSALSTSGGGSSFNSGLSSALGVFGDIGVAGFVAYAGLLGSILLAVRKTASPEGIAAAAGLAMFTVLGLVFDWWEQPPFSVFLAVLAGLALSQARSTAGPQAPDPPRRPESE